jgi:outer membrane protein TolC
MMTPSQRRHALSARFPTTLLLALIPLILVVSAGTTRAQESPIPVYPASETAAPTVLTLSLADCVQLALQRQPRIQVRRASLAATEDSSRALESLRIPAVFDPEIPIRRKQAALGVTAAVALVDQAERATVYAVTRTFFTVIYARDQERVARAVVDRLTATYDTAKQQLDAGAADITAKDVDKIQVYMRLAEVKRIQAAQGIKRAQAALREAIGLGLETCVDVPPGRLPEPQVRPCKEEALALALARRGELIRASVFADVVCLEIDAQGSAAHKLKMDTFAAGSDIHAEQVPQDVRNQDYRPGAVPPEMPTLLVGQRAERMKRAHDLHARARFVVDMTRDLIALEVEDAYLRWEEASLQAAKAREAVDIGDKLAENVRKNFTVGLKEKVEDVINTRVLASQAHSQYNEYLYNQILALADLERATAGGFCAGLFEAPPQAQRTPAPAKKTTPGKDDLFPENGAGK